MKGSIADMFSVFAVLIVLLIIGLLVFTFLNSQSNYAPQFPSFQDTHGAVPLAFASVLNQSSQQTTSQLSASAQSAIAKSTEFSVSYNGSIYIRPSGITGSIAKINSPLYVKEEKYGNELKLSINATSLPILGSGNIFLISLANGTYACSNFNASAIASKNYGKIVLGNHNVSCIRSDSIAGINLSSMAAFNLSSLASIGVQFNYQKSYQSTYNQMPCTFLSGTLSQPGSNGTTSEGLFQMCISDIYYLPLSLSMYFNSNQGSGSLSLNESSIGDYSSKSYVESVP